MRSELDTLNALPQSAYGAFIPMLEAVLAGDRAATRETAIELALAADYPEPVRLAERLLEDLDKAGWTNKLEPKP
jgi:hypothetical protein